MSYKIAFKKSVSRDLKKLSKDNVERILDKIEQDLPEKADTFPLLTGKFAGLRKFRIGDYRVIYTINDKTKFVDIIAVRHRRDAYR